MTKPDWKTGDIMVLLRPKDKWRPTEPRRAFHLFESERNPREECGKWFYGFAPAEDVRKATVADCERFIEIQQRAVAREQEQLRRLVALRDKIQEGDTDDAIAKDS